MSEPLTHAIPFGEYGTDPDEMMSLIVAARLMQQGQLYMPAVIGNHFPPAFRARQAKQTLIELGYGMVEVGMGYQHQVDGGKVAELHSRLAQALQHKQPAGKIGIDDHVLAAHLDEKAGVADERQAQLAIAYQFRFIGLAAPGNHGGVAHQLPKRARAFAEDGIRKRWL